MENVSENTLKHRLWVAANPEKSKEINLRSYQKHIERHRERDRNRPQRRQPYAKQRAWELKREYGITWEEYQAMLVAQEYKCAICQKHMDPPCVDHCHSRNKVRGLLCSSCNRGLGLLKDDVALLKIAVAYLERE